MEVIRYTEQHERIRTGRTADSGTNHDLRGNTTSPRGAGAFPSFLAHAFGILFLEHTIYQSGARGHGCTVLPYLARLVGPLVTLGFNSADAPLLAGFVKVSRYLGNPRPLSVVSTRCG